MKKSDVINQEIPVYKQLIEQGIRKHLGEKGYWVDWGWKECLDAHHKGETCFCPTILDVLKLAEDIAVKIAEELKLTPEEVGKIYCYTPH